MDTSSWSLKRQKSKLNPGLATSQLPPLLGPSPIPVPTTHLPPPQTHAHIQLTSTRKHMSKIMTKSRVLVLSLSYCTNEIFQTPAKKKYISIQVGLKLRVPSVLVVNSVSFCLSFFLSTSIAATYIFTPPTCTITIISLEPCALNAEL